MNIVAELILRCRLSKTDALETLDRIAAVAEDDIYLAQDLLDEYDIDASVMDIP